MVSPSAAAAANGGTTEAVNPASPALKRPRQPDQAAPSAMVRDVTLPQLVQEFAELHSRFARDEISVTGVHDAVDHNAVILRQALARLDTIEGKLTAAETVVTQLDVDPKANDDRLDTQLREEFN